MQSTNEEQIYKEGLEIFSLIKQSKISMFDKHYWLGRMMEWVMKDPDFKTDLFRFVDVLPVLKTNDQVSKHVNEYLIDKHKDISRLMGAALKAASFSMTKGLFASAIRKNVTEMAERFILGADINKARLPLQQLKKSGFSYTVDLLGEKALSDSECDQYLAHYKEIIKTLATIDGHDENDPPNVSIKVTGLAHNLKEEDPVSSMSYALERIEPLLTLAQEKGVFVNFDLETWATNEIVMGLFLDLIQRPQFSSWPHMGIVVQAYLLKSSLELNNIIEICKKRACPITVRLVKGAYWDYEVIRAEQLGVSCPVYVDKAKTDLNYEALSRLLLDNIDVVRPAFGSHNIRSLAQAIAYAQSKGIKKEQYEIQMLYGMAEAERKALLARGHHVRLYVPIGEMIPGMSYLVRRLLENTSQMGFIKMSQHDKINEKILLEKPRPCEQESIKEERPTFNNDPHLDFTIKEVRESFKAHIDVVAKALPFVVPVIVGNKTYDSAKTKKNLSPNDREKVVSVIALAEIKHAKEAVNESFAQFDEFAATPLSKRREHLSRLANILREDLYYLSAIICHEVGKTWAEAAADVEEAIDFCNYYAAQADSLKEQKLLSMSGEENRLYFQGRGPTVIIAPWNFPLAIICGMSVAAYVAGNPIILKPAEASSLTAFKLYERMMRAGFDPRVCHFLPGLGEEIGAYLVKHPLIANICFTGSMEVGHQIMKNAQSIEPDQVQMKRVISEMGGKNAMIIDDDADLDEAIVAIIKSAFLFAGQKCSAASRIITVGTIKEQCIARLIDASKSMVIGSSLLPNTFMGPVIDLKAYERLLNVIEKIKQDQSVSVLYEGPRLDKGFFVPPLIVMVNDSKHWLMQEELFGPIIAVYAAENLERALMVAHDTKFALTGSFFSRSPQNISLVKKRFKVGNLYINQKCTGALVYRQPFGGFKMSGTGIKAGGPHYLLNFVDMRSISENTMRRGFAPEL